MPSIRVLLFAPFAQPLLTSGLPQSQGCCFSRPAGPNAPYPGNASSRAINLPPPPVLQASTTEDGSSIGGAGNASSTTRVATAAAATGRSRPRDADEDEDDDDEQEEDHRHRRHHHHHHRRSAERRRHRDRDHQRERPLSEHIDKPLRPHRWTARKHPWTRTALDTERADFFDTRVTGRSEVWQVIRAALEILWAADLQRRAAPTVEDGDEHDMHSDRDGDADTDADATDESLATAQSILRAAEVTLPTGNLANGVYDALGNYYALPEWIVCDPVNIAEDSGTRATTAPDRKADGDDAGEDLDGSDEDGDDDDEIAALRRREEKGKAVASVRDTVKVCARLSENGQDVVVRTAMEESVRSVAIRVMEGAGVSLWISFPSHFYFPSLPCQSHPIPRPLLRPPPHPITPFRHPSGFQTMKSLYVTNHSSSYRLPNASASPIWVRSSKRTHPYRSRAGRRAT